jgi:tRNA-binding protein
VIANTEGCQYPVLPGSAVAFDHFDFGGLGIGQSSAQITQRYRREVLEGRLVVAVVNLRPRQAADFRSDVLVLGALGSEGEVVLLPPDQDVALGARIA